MQTSAQEPQRFIDRAREGWFWYEDPPPEAEVEPPAPEAEVAPAPAAQASDEPESPPPAAPAPPPGPAPFSAEWLEAEMEGYRARAIDDPSPQNVRAYLLLQRVAMDKAQAFADAVQDATLGDPLLDATFERPLAPFAVAQVDREAQGARMALLGLLGESAGLVFFYRSDCPYCEQQAPLLAALSDQAGLEVLPVALDAAPLPSGAFAAAWRADRGEAAALGVATTPTIYLLRPPDELHLLGEGLLSLDELTARILRIARRAGWISEEAYAATRPARRLRRDVRPENIDPTILGDAAALATFLQSRMRGD